MLDGPQKANAFLRAATPDNRRIISDAYSLPGCFFFCPEKEKEKSSLSLPPDGKETTTSTTPSKEAVLANNNNNNNIAAAGGGGGGGASMVEQHAIRRQRLCFKEKTVYSM